MNEDEYAAQAERNLDLTARQLLTEAKFEMLLDVIDQVWKKEEKKIDGYDSLKEAIDCSSKIRVRDLLAAAEDVDPETAALILNRVNKINT